MKSRLRHPMTEGITTVNFLTGENCTVVFTDVVGFGARERTDRDRAISRAANLDMMRASLRKSWP